MSMLALVDSGREPTSASSTLLATSCALAWHGPERESQRGDSAYATGAKVSVMRAANAERARRTR